MKKINLYCLLLVISAFAYGQESPTISANGRFWNINIRANTSSVPVIRFTRWTGGGSDQHNAYVGQFYNAALSEYSFGIGTGFSASGSQDLANTTITATLAGNVGIGTITPNHKFEIADVSGIPSFGIKGNLDSKIVFEPSDGSDRFTIWSDMDYNTYNDLLRFGAAGAPDILTLKGNGNVGIGTTTPQNKLDVNGTVHAKEVKVDLTGWPDYVFNDDYKLLSLAEIKTYIDKNKHLPEVPSAKEMEANGVKLGEMNMLLLKKIEELRCM